MKIFVLCSRVPLPLEKGDKLRIYHQIKELHKIHSVTLCCLSTTAVSEENRKKLTEICDRLEIISLNKIKLFLRMGMAFFSRKPFQVHYFYQKSAQRKIDRIIGESKPDHIYCQLIRCSEYVKKHFLIPKTLDYMDALSKGVERRIDRSAWYLKPFVKEEYRRLVTYEHLIFDYFDYHSIISKQDRQLIIHPDRKHIAIIANGVDADFFQPRPAEKKFTLVFTGNMNYPPNVEGAQFIACEILPLVRLTKPTANLFLAGANPHQKVKELQNDHVVVSGWIDDIRDAYAGAQIFIAPMRLGTGLQNKLLEAMSMELPCITSEMANNALGAKGGSEVLIGYTAEEYADLICRLLDHPEEAKTLALAGRNFVMSHYNWTATTGLLSGLFKT